MIERLGFWISEIVSHFGSFPIRGLWLVEVQQNCGNSTEVYEFNRIAEIQ